MFSSIVYLRNVTSYRRCNEGFQTASLEKGDVADAGDLFDGNGGDEDEDARLAARLQNFEYLTATVGEDAAIYTQIQQGSASLGQPNASRSV